MGTYEGWGGEEEMIYLNSIFPFNINVIQQVNPDNPTDHYNIKPYKWINSNANTKNVYIYFHDQHYQHIEVLPNTEYEHHKQQLSPSTNKKHKSENSPSISTINNNHEEITETATKEDVNRLKRHANPIEKPEKQEKITSEGKGTLTKKENKMSLIYSSLFQIHINRLSNFRGDMDLPP